MLKEELKNNVSEENLILLGGLNEVIELRNSNFNNTIERALQFQKDIDSILYESCLSDKEIEGINIKLEQVTFSFLCDSENTYRDISIIVYDGNDNYYIPTCISDYIQKDNLCIGSYALKILINNKEEFIKQLIEKISK